MGLGLSRSVHRFIPLEAPSFTLVEPLIPVALLAITSPESWTLERQRGVASEAALKSFPIIIVSV